MTRLPYASRSVGRICPTRERRPGARVTALREFDASVGMRLPYSDQFTVESTDKGGRMLIPLLLRAHARWVIGILCAAFVSLGVSAGHVSAGSSSFVLKSAHRSVTATV